MLKLKSNVFFVLVVCGFLVAVVLSQQSLSVASFGQQGIIIAHNEQEDNNFIGHYIQIINKFRLINRAIQVNDRENAVKYYYEAEEIFANVKLLPYPEDINIGNFLMVQNKVTDALLLYHYSGLSMGSINKSRLAINEFEYFIISYNNSIKVILIFNPDLSILQSSRY